MHKLDVLTVSPIKIFLFLSLSLMLLYAFFSFDFFDLFIEGIFLKIGFLLLYFSSILDKSSTQHANKFSLKKLAFQVNRESHSVRLNLLAKTAFLDIYHMFHCLCYRKPLQ